MIELIEEAIHDNYDYDPDLGWYVNCETVLDRIEEAGMLPPILPDKEVEHIEIPFNCSADTYMEKNIYVWEPETCNKIKIIEADGFIERCNCQGECPDEQDKL